MFCKSCPYSVIVLAICFTSCFQENYLGEDQHITDMNSSLDLAKDRRDEQDSYVHVDNPEDSRAAFDIRMYRPLSVTVSVVLHDIQAHLVKVCLVYYVDFLKLT